MIGLGRVGRLARKEISESLRDRRTVLTLVLMPLLLYPLLAIAFRQLLLSAQAEKAATPYRVAYLSEAERESVLNWWRVGHQVLGHRAAQADKSQEPALPPHVSPAPEWRSLVTDDPEEAVSQGRADLAVRLRPKGGFVPDPGRLLFIDLQLSYRQDSPAGQDAARYAEVLTAAANSALLDRGLQLIKVHQRGDPVRLLVRTVPDLAPRRNQLFPVLVPLILILMTITGAVYPAIDLTAGERERGTLEILVAAPIPRLSVLVAKYLAVVTVAVLTALMNLTAMTATLYASGIGRALFAQAVTPVVLVQVLGLLVLFAAFFSAVLLAITSFARSFKEAQAYLIPVMLLALAPGVVGLLPGLALEGPLAVVPLLNVVLLARDLFEGVASPAAAAVVVLTTLLYAVAAVATAARVFGAEAVLSSEQSGWGDVFSRPRLAASAPTPSAALLCLALLFPAYFLLTGGLSQIPGISPGGKLLMMGGANLFLFGLFPLASAWAGRVRLVPGFQLRLPPALAAFSGLLLGLSLWPFVHELGLLLRQAGVSTLRPEALEKVKDVLVQWRELSPVAVVASLALIPALLEELFFRGYLFSAFRASGLGGAGKPVAVVAGTAVLFALFHLLVTDSLAVERVPPSLALGLVLGTLAWRSGSVWPGVVLHVSHNAILVLLGYYQPLLEERGWVPAGEGHLPWQVLAGAGAVAALGLVALLLTRGRVGVAREEPAA